MNERTAMTPIQLSIAAVERDTGLSKDTLRVWERRYGFPTPERDAVGERVYLLDQVEKLRVIKRLLDAGHRPGRIVPLPFDDLQQLAGSTVDQPLRGTEAALGSADLRDYLQLIRDHDAQALRNRMQGSLARFGVARFVLEVIAPLNSAVGDAWMRGQLDIFEEHQYTEQAQGVLRQAIASVPAVAGGGSPRVLLSTFPGEPHGLGLLMAEAILALEGCRCTSLGVQTPLWNLALAAGAFQADIVALGFTGCMNPNHIVDGLQELRAKIAPPVAIWAGGSAPVLQRRRIEGVQPMGSLQQIPAALALWRSLGQTGMVAAV